MDVRRLARAALAGAALWSLAMPAAAESPFRRLRLFKEVEADPSKDYSITDDNGPWMITAATFAGEGGDEQAHALALELRREHRLEAYVHSKKFDFTDTVQGLHVDKYGRPKKMKYSRSYAGDEFAVLVGNYGSSDDPKAQRDLEKIKYLYPDALRPNAAGKSNQQLAWWHNMQRKFKAMGTGKTVEKPKGPMGRAFVTTNPLLPPEFFVTKGVDRLVEKMNKGVEHSLLDCPGKYSVQVASFKGKVVIDKDKVANILATNAPPSNELAEAAEKAHKVCEALRAKGYEAYEFHDRGMSIVTVGSFDSVGTPRADGKTEINPKIHKIMQVFGSTELQMPAHYTYGKDILRPAMARRLTEIAGIPLDAQPLPIMTPKKSFASSVGGR